MDVDVRLKLAGPQPWTWDKLPRLTDHPPPAEAVTTRTAHIWLGSDGIIRVKPHARLHESLEDAVENVAAVGKVGLGMQRPLLIDLTLAGPQSAECRAHYMSTEAKRHTKAMAIVTRSLLARVVASFIMGSNRTNVPVRLFENEALAVAWLQGERPSAIPE